MKVILTLEEAKAMIRGEVAKRLDPSIQVSPQADVRFFSRTGENQYDATNMLERVEVEIA